MANEFIKSRKCSKCASLWQSNTTDTICSSCKCSDLFEGLPEDSKKEIDLLVFGNEILPGIEKIRDYLLISLNQSHELFTWRHSRLRDLHPTLFTVSSEKYWQSFQS